LIWSNQVNLDKIVAFDEVIDELVAENHDFVLLGDEDAYDWFLNDNQANMTDGLHPNSGLGRETLADFWASAILSDYEYQVNPNTEWLSDVNEFTLDESGTLTFTIDKYLGEFTGAVKVTDDNDYDETLVSGTDFTAGESSTVIELLNSYLNTLGAGTYTLNVEFAGGVWVESTFTISASGVITPTPINPNAPAVPGLTSPNTGSNLGKLLAENRSVVLAGLAIVIAGLGISVVLDGRKLTTRGQ
jgi:hypothetical protein